MRVLYDTNALVQVFARRGEILIFRELLLKRQITHITSAFILEEVETVLTSRLGLTRQKAKVATRIIAKVSTVVKPIAIEKLTRDPGDDHVLAAAIVGEAEYLVTGDKDLLILKEYNGIQMISLAKFKNLIRAHRKEQA